MDDESAELRRRVEGWTEPRIVALVLASPKGSGQCNGLMWNINEISLRN
jgi:hypothetical protein